MTKSEITIASQAYEAGYKQACEDCIKAFSEIRRQAFESGMTSFAQMIDERMKQAVNQHFNALCKGK